MSSHHSARSIGIAIWFPNPVARIRNPSRWLSSMGETGSDNIQLNPVPDPVGSDMGYAFSYPGGYENGYRIIQSESEYDRVSYYPRIPDYYSDYPEYQIQIIQRRHDQPTRRGVAALAAATVSGSHPPPPPTRSQLARDIRWLQPSSPTRPQCPLPPSPACHPLAPEGC